MQASKSLSPTSPALLRVVLCRQERLREAAEAEARAKRLEAEAQVGLGGVLSGVLWGCCVGQS